MVTYSGLAIANCTLAVTESKGLSQYRIMSRFIASQDHSASQNNANAQARVLMDLNRVCGWFGGEAKTY